jgi:prepilin-type processing-associated H-X9-DG protein
MIGEKHLNTDRLLDANYGDGTFYSDDWPISTVRLAGPSYPLAVAPTDPIVALGDTALGRFGSWHPGGGCNFALADGSVQKLQPTIDSTVLGYLANINDGHAIPAGAY